MHAHFLLLSFPCLTQMAEEDIHHVHIVSLGVKCFENLVNSRTEKIGPQTVRNYVKASLENDFNEFKPADNRKHREIFVRSFRVHYPEFADCELKIIDARKVCKRDPASMLACRGHCGFHPVIKQQICKSTRFLSEAVWNWGIA